MNLMHIKLKTGVDLVSYIIEDDGTYLTLKDPIQFGFDPNRGIFGINWLLFADETTVRIKYSDVYFHCESSDKATEYYSQFITKYDEKKEESNYISELESIFEAMMESKGSIKH